MCSNMGVSVEVTTSFPNPAQDYYHGPVSLDQHFVPHPATTFFLHIHGDGLTSHGILDGDLVIVDRALSARPGLVIVVIIDGEHRIGTWCTLEGRAHLATDLDSVPLRSHDQPWGVVTAAIHGLLRP